MYIVYETTNLVNGKYYVGVHKIDGRNYLGSGKLLRLAIKKYGRSNFIRETLMEFEHKHDAYSFEKIVVNIALVDNVNCYNISKGGLGGVSMYGSCNPSKRSEVRNKISISKQGSNNGMYGIKHTDDWRTNHKKFMVGRYKGKNNPYSKRWFIFGKEFDCLRKASDKLDVSKATIQRWCEKYNIPHCYSIKRDKHV